jgi:hypothetical protein
MWWFLASPAFQPFTIAALVMLGLLAIELVGMLLGASASTMLGAMFGLHGVHADTWLHHGADADTANLAAHGGIGHAAGGPLAGAFDWLNVGRVPLLVLIIAAIASFAVAGMLLQILAMHLVAPLPPTMAAAIAVAASVPGTRWTSRTLARLLPRDETYALGEAGLIGLVGIVTLGPVQDGAAARAKVQDRYGNWHFPRVAPGAPGLAIPQGASVLFVDRAGGLYTVIPAEGRLAAGEARSSRT